MGPFGTWLESQKDEAQPLVRRLAHGDRQLVHPLRLSRYWDQCHGPAVQGCLWRPRGTYKLRRRFSAFHAIQRELRPAARQKQKSPQDGSERGMLLRLLAS